MIERYPISFVNKTNYFNPELSKTRITVSSPLSYCAKSSKQEGYELRLYWEFRNCLSKNGQVFFYTLTYNDKSIPYYEGIPCFDYKDLSYFLNGGFRKYLLRHYGTSLKYFVGAELGEGKGSRGLESNPHYHCLFYLLPAEDDRYPYLRISPIQFRSLVRKYWQGFDQDKDGFHSFKSALFGIVKEGENLGLVSDFRAVSYVCKYVTKDVSLIKSEKYIKDLLFHRYFPEVYSSDSTVDDFLNIVYQRFLSGSGDLPSSVGLFSSICQDLCPNLFKMKGFTLDSCKYDYFEDFLIESHQKDEYYSFVLNIVEDMIRIDINTFRNRYSNKCRISQGVGLYGLDFYDESSQTLEVPTKNGFECRKINLYYYRKLYYDVVKDDLGQNIYILNSRGIDMKVSNLERSATRLTERVSSIIDALDSSLYDSVIAHVRVSSFLPYESFIEHINYLSSTYKQFNIYKHYAYYKLVYEGRFFKINRSELDSSVIYPSLDVLADYRRFLEPAYYSSFFNPTGVIDFLKADNKVYSSYSNHPYFSPFTSIFDCFDLLVNFFFATRDKKIEDHITEIKSTKRLFDKLNLKHYYSSFNF